MILASKKAIESAEVRTAADVCSRSENLIVLSPKLEADLAAFGKFMYDSVYMHEELLAAAKRTEERLSALFGGICRKPELMPQYYVKLAAREGLERVVCDYIAGMTDRYFLAMHDNIS